MRISFLILIHTMLLSAFAVDFPGKRPGRPELKTGDTFSLSNRVIKAQWMLKNGNIRLVSLHNKLTGKIYAQDCPAFFLKSTKLAEGIKDWVVSKPLTIETLKVDKKSPRNGDHFSGKALVIHLRSKKEKIRIIWRAILRHNANYIRTEISISSPQVPATISSVELIAGVKVPNIKQIGVHEKGCAVKGGQMFFGLEVPFFKNILEQERISSLFECELPLEGDKSYSFSAVMGVYPKGQLRRAFLHYIERERARSYKPLLHYNCWYDLERKVSEEGMLDRINHIHRELGEKRGIHVASYVVDDGYDDYKKGFWVFDKKKFPRGFTPLAKRLTEVKSNLGIWLSPGAGYLGRGDRIQRAKEIGIPSLNLSDSRYYKWFFNTHKSFIKKYKVNYFKWDRLGSSVSGHFLSLMEIGSKLRKLNPDLFLNTTVGTWQSPFWLNQIDCTWRGEMDMGYTGKGSNHREKWLNYRDGVSYKAIAKSEFLYPLNALMNHGIVFANGHPVPRRAF
ncbi:MAG: alpha-galactosidase, partial [Lentisphaeraceae bacterium]|nr:alpha-galactosidase [Lentisphaeraceae bacterium]